MHSCLYRGQIGHFRPSPAHRFRYSTSWAYLDLAEVDRVVRSSWLLSEKAMAPACFRREDHFGDSSLPMLEAVYQFVEQKTGVKLSGPVRLLTQLRHFGIYFSPVNIFYCFDDRESLVALVAEVSNTPWNERHCYVLWEGNRLELEASEIERPSTPPARRYGHAKEFHVSPFMGMDSQYDWRVDVPSETLHLSLGCVRQGDRIFQADLHLRRRELNDLQLARCLLRRPIAAAHILGAIYYQALRLWMKKCQFYPHPVNSPEPNSPEPNSQRPNSQQAMSPQPALQEPVSPPPIAKTADTATRQSAPPNEARQLEQV